MRFIYAVKHWLLTLLLAPLASILVNYIGGESLGAVIGYMEIYPIVVLFSMAFSIPTFLIYIVCFHFLIEYSVKPALSKFILISLTVMGIGITLFSFGGKPEIELMLAYSITAILCGTILRIRQAKKGQQSSEFSTRMN